MDIQNIGNPVGGRSLLRDPYVRAAVVLVLLLSIPMASPALKSDFWRMVYPYYFDAPVLALTALALWSARRAAASRQAVRFWSLLAVGFVFWLAIRILGPVLTHKSPVAALATDLLYLAFYLFLILAFQVRPHLRPHEPGANLIHQLESAGATLFGFGLLVYFVVIPATYAPSTFLTNVPSTTLFVVLNFYLFLRALALCRSSGHEPWRRSYELLAMATLGFVVLDGIDLATRIDTQLDAVVRGTLFESLWLLPMLGFIAAARVFALSGYDDRASHTDDDGEHLVWKSRGGLTYFAIVPALIHIALEIPGWSDTQTRVPREIFVICWIVLAAALGIIYDRRIFVQQRRLERRHRQVNQRLEVAERMDAVRRMAGGIAHDFNNLLMVIQGFAVDLASRLGNPDDRSDAEQISRASDRAASLTRKLLALGSHEKIGSRAFRPDTVLGGIERTLRQQSNGSLELDLQETAYVNGAQGEFEDAVLNLVLNAREAIAQDGHIKLRTGPLEVTSDDVLAETLGPGAYVYVAVEDDGAGMDENTRRHIFEPFFTKREGGTGLGLSMVYSFAREAGGTVEVTSQLGKGSQFRIILPQGEPPGAIQENAGRHLPVEDQSRTVLLVEDENSVRSMLRRSLEHAGFTVLEAPDGSAALRILEGADAAIDVVVTDVVMPKMDGGRLARHIRESSESLPIIFMSGHSAGQIGQLGKTTKNAYMLVKPFAAAELLTAIENCLDAAA